MMMMQMVMMMVMMMTMMMLMMILIMMPRGEERDREEEEVVYNDQPESDQHFNLPRIQVILMILSMLAIIMDEMEMKLV